MTNDDELVDALTGGRDFEVFKDGVLYAIETIISVGDNGRATVSYEIRAYSYPDPVRLMDTAPTPERAVAALVAIAGATMSDVEVAP